VYAALTVVALTVVNAYGNAVLPLYRWELGWLAPNYQIQTLKIEGADAEPVFRIVVRDSDLVSVDGHLQNGPTIGCEALVMYGLQHMVLVLLVPLAWPGLGWKDRVAGLVFSLPVLLFVELADMPVVIVGGLDAAKVDLCISSVSLPVVWMKIMDTGGRLALGLAGGLLACRSAALFYRSSP